MPNLSEGVIQVFDNSVSSINTALYLILARLDGIKGLRGDPTIYASPTVGAPVGQQQAARLADLPTEQPSSLLFWLLAPKANGPGVAPDALVDNTGGTPSATLMAVGGTTALTDTSGGTPTDTLNALGGVTPLTDSSGGAADDTIAAITQVANVGSADVAPTADAIADLAAKVNGLIADMADSRDNFATLASRVNTLLQDMTDTRDNLASLATALTALTTALQQQGALV